MLRKRAWNGDHIKMSCFFVPEKQTNKHGNQIDLILIISSAQIEKMTEQR